MVPNTTQYSCPKQLHTLRHFITQNEPLHGGKLIIQSNSLFFLIDSEYSLFFPPMESKNKVIGHSHLVAPSNSSTHTLFYGNNWILFYIYMSIFTSSMSNSFMVSSFLLEVSHNLSEMSRYQLHPSICLISLD